MKNPNTWELVRTTSRGKQYFGFARRGSDGVTLTGQSKRFALQIINELYHGTPYVPLTGEDANVPDVDDLSDNDGLGDDPATAVAADEEVESV